MFERSSKDLHTDVEGRHFEVVRQRAVSGLAAVKKVSV